MKKYIIPAIFLCFVFSTLSLSAQYYDPEKGCLVDTPGGDCLSNTLLSAAPFLRINPSARAGALGDAGIALSPDANALHFNASALSFVEKDFGISATYSPWLRQLGLEDVFLAYLTGYKKIDEISALGFGVRFFSLGDVPFTTQEGDPIGTGKPREMEISAAYSRKLGKNFSTAISGKYIYSNLAAGHQLANEVEATAANAVATDISMTYITPLFITGFDSDLSLGLAITNLGSKISYTKDIRKDYLPANLGIGVAWNLDFDQYNSLTLIGEINKLLIPSPIPYLDTEHYDVKPKDGIPDYKQQSTVGAAINSFNDASGGLNEEFRELYYSIGTEYWYDNQFALRTGYYYEHPLKGDRQFITFGFGLKYHVMSIDVSYLVPTTRRKSPLDNTMRFAFMYELGD